MNENTALIAFIVTLGLYFSYPKLKFTENEKGLLCEEVSSRTHDDDPSLIIKTYQCPN